MRKYKAILSVFFLCTFSVVLLHSAIPHIHNAYNDHSKEDNHVHYYEHDGHTHQHVHHHEKNWLDILLGLFENSNHSAMEDGDIEYYTCQYQLENSSEKVQELNTQNELLEELFMEELELEKVQVRPPILPDQYQCCSDPLRGPPSKS